MSVSKNKFIVNVIWRFFERTGAQLVSFIVTLVIARLVTPEVFGVVALISVFIGVLQVFIDSGLGNALVQKKDVDNIDFSTVFYVNIFFCLIVYVVLFLTAPLISNFFANDDLTIYIRILGLLLIISGIKNVQQAYVSRNFLFKKFFFSTIIGTTMAAVIGVYLAKKNYGVWALIVQQLINAFVDTLIVWCTVKWRPSLTFSFSRLQKLYSFAWKMLATSLINTIYNKLRELLIGRYYSSSDLAYYNRGNILPLLIIQNLDASLSSVLLPTLSNIQDNKEKMKQIVKRTIKINTYILYPCLIGMVSVSNTLIYVLFSNVWMPSVPYLILFCYGYMFYPFYSANLNLIAAIGRSDLYLKIEIVKKSIGLILLFLTFRYGVYAIAVSFLFERFFEMFIDVIPSGRMINYSLLEQIRDIVPNFFISMIMGIIVFFIGKLEINMLILLMIQLVSGGLIYVSLSYIFNNESFHYLVKAIKRK